MPTKKETRPEAELFLDDHRGHYIGRDFAQCIKRDRLVVDNPRDAGTLDRDLDILAAYDEECPICDGGRRTTGEDRIEECDACEGTGRTSDEVADCIFEEVCDHVRVVLRAEHECVPADEVTRMVWLDAVESDDVRQLALVRENATIHVGAWLTSIADTEARKRAEAIAQPVLGRFEMRDGALWIIPCDMVFDEETDEYFYVVPMRITLEHGGDDARYGQVTVTADDPRQARHDQSIEGSSWECSDDFAYTMITDHPSLYDSLVAQGYVVDASSYSALNEKLHAPDPDSSESGPLCGGWGYAPDPSDYEGVPEVDCPECMALVSAQAAQIAALAKVAVQSTWLMSTRGPHAGEIVKLVLKA